MNHFVNPELTVFFASMLPLVEARAAIPYGIFAHNLDPVRATLFALAGSALSILVAAPLLYRFGERLAARSPAAPYAARIFAWTRGRHEKRFMRKAKALALFLFVAVPLPFSGAWSGMLAGFVFGIPLRATILACMLGSLASSLPITLSIMGIRYL